MELKKHYLALAVVSAALTGCGGSSSSSGGSTTVASYNVDCDDTDMVCTVTGTINEDYTFTSDYTWVLDDFVFVGVGNVTEVSSDTDVAAVKAAGVTLTIEAGTDIRGTDDGVLVVTRGSSIDAEGTASSPITFSSYSDDDYDGLGEWGGVIIQGFAPEYGAGNTGVCYGTGTTCNVEGEGGDEVGLYGGNITDDNSGVLKYVRIAEAGYVAGPNNEINGLTLQGVGHGTDISYVQVHGSLDDGIEWFGGTVNVTNVVLTNNDDDDIDFDEGYQGNIQFAIIRKDPDATAPQGSNDPRGIEANSSDEDYVEDTNAAVANVLYVGGPASATEPSMRLRGALTVSVYNTASLGSVGCVRIDDADIDGQGTMAYSDVTLADVIGECGTAGTVFYVKRDADLEVGTVGAGSVAVDEYAALTSNYTPTSTTSMTAVDNGSAFAFETANYIGAVEPGTTSPWWSGWIIEGSLDGIENSTNDAE
ncbi:MAG: hypothetical protein KYX62_08480 [Pseudomonadota bacterium]|nr:hypothetical protein [Pseudomonadota bacterium]